MTKKGIAIAAFAVVVGLILIWIDLEYHWTAYSSFTSAISPLTAEETHAHQKTIWEWLELLVVPAAIAISALIYGSLERRNEQNIAEKRRKEDRETAQRQLEEDRRIAEQQLAEDRRIADERAQEAALQSYLEQMSALLLDKDLRTSGNDTESRAVARAWTLTILRRVKGERKGVLLRFLYEADLIMKENKIVSLEGADLAGAKLIRVNLTGADLEGANLSLANLSLANLEGASLEKAGLGETNLIGAKLVAADLRDAHLEKARLAGAKLMGADLRDAHLLDANLRRANLEGADLAGANLIRVNLEGANLRGATLDAALYDASTRWPKGFNPEEAGAEFVP